MRPRRVVITGGSAGIGRYMAAQLRADGHEVVVLDVTPGQGDIACDVADARQVRDAVAEAEARMGGVDVAVHNAAVCPFGAFLAADDARFRRAWEVNLLGAVHLAREVLPSMLERRSGRIAFVSSGVGVTGFTDIAPYASSKGAIEALARSLRAEYAGTGVTFHLMHPPLTRTATAAGLAVPDQVKADPEDVGRGLARRLFDRGFVLTHSRAQAAQIRASYLFPLSLGRLMTTMTRRAQGA